MIKNLLLPSRGSWLVGLCLALLLLLSSGQAWAQLTGPKNIGTDYVTLAAAITALNGQGVGSGGVTFNVPAGYTETFASPTAGAITATGTSANPIVFQKSGSGANPIITAGVGGSTTSDAIISLAGSDYVTFNGINLTDPTTNTTATTAMEIGYLLGRTGTGATLNGANNNTITNCTVTLQRALVNTTNYTPAGICSASGTATAPFTALSPASATAAGQSSNNVFTSNTLTNVNTGIYLLGLTDASPYTNYDQNNAVGGNSSGLGNTVQNFGGTANNAYGIRLYYQNGVTTSYNNINNTAGGGVASANTLYGIQLASSVNANSTTTNNTVALSQSAVSSSVYGIANATSGTGAVSISNNIFTFVSAGSTHTYYAVYSSAVLSGALTVNGNTFLNAGNSVASIGNLAFLYNSNSNTGAINFQNNQWTLNRTAASGTVYGYYNVSSPTGTHNFSGNTFSNITLAGSTTFYGFNVLTSSSQLQNITNNTLNNITSGSGTTAGIYGAYGFNGSVISGNTVTNLSGGGTVYGIYTGIAFVGGNVFGNTVGNVSSSGASSTVAGMYIGSGASPLNCYTNKIYSISTSGATGLAYGLNLSSGTTLNAYNNLIGNVSATASTSGTAAAGIGVGGATTVTLYYNTVYLSATNTAAGNSAGIYASTTPTLTLTDNIVVNATTPTGAGIASAYQRSSTTLTTYSASSNNNLFYTASSPSATRPIYYDGATTYPTFAAYKTFMATRDQASVSENSPFASTTGSASTFLHIATGSPTQVESGGKPVSGITTDYDGDTRNATTPDIGADEGTFTPAANMTVSGITYTQNATNTGQSATNQQVTGVNVATTGSLNPLTLSSITFNLGSTSVADITNAKLYSTSGSTFMLASAMLLPSTSTIAATYTLTLTTPATLASGNNYFWLTYDITSTATPGNTVSSTVAANGVTISSATYSATLSGPAGSRTIIGPLSGTYYVTATVGSSPNPAKEFPTLTAAANAYSTLGVSSAVSFVLLDATYSGSETFPIVLNAVASASSTNTLTIKPGSGISPVLSGSVASGAMLQFNGAQYVTLDGSNAGTTSQNWTITNTNTGTGTQLVQLISNTAGLAPANNTVKNMVLTGAASATTFTTGYGIQMAVASPATTGASNNTFQNNAITKVQTGISVVGLSNTVRDANTSITGNQIGSTTAAAGFGGATALGIAASNQNMLTVTGNVVRNPVIVAAGANSTTGTALISASTLIGIDLTSNITTATVANNTVRDLLTSGSSLNTSPLSGIRVGTAVTSATVNANLVTNIKTTNTGGYGGYGLYVNTGAASTGDVLSNNMVSDINGSNFSGFTNSSSAGIYLSGTQSGISLVYNSVNMYGTSTYSSAVNTAALAVETGSTGLTVQNNVLANSLVGSTTGSLPFSLFSNAPATAYTVINNNDYYSSGTQATDPVIFRINGTNGTTMLALRTATTQDGASIPAAPAFTAANDLHTSSTALNAAGAPIAGITTDFDGQTRDATTPDIGADEFTPPTDDAGVVAITQPVAPFSASVQNIAVQVKNFGVATLNTVTVSYTVNGVAQTPQNLTGLNLAPGATSADLVLGTFDFSVGGPSFTIVATTSLPNGNTDTNTANDSFTRTVTPALCGTYTVGTGQQFTTLDAAVTALNAGGASCAVTFTLTDATYPATSGITINQYPGNSSTNTLTIKPAVGISSTITGSVATGAILKLNGVQYVTIDGSNNGTTSQNLTLTNTSATGSGNAVLWVAAASASAGSSFNTVKNTLITGNSGTGFPQFTVFVGSTSTTPGTTTATPAANSNNTFTNNVISKGYYGVFVFGVSTTVLDQNNTFSGNQIGQSGTSNGFGLEGLRAVYQQGLTVQSNEVQNVTNTVAAYHFGLNLQTVKGAIIDRNLIHDVQSGTTSSGYPGIGIEVANATHTTTGNASANQISNNIVYNISAPVSSTGSFPNAIGIACNGGYGDKIYFNTLLMNVAQTAGTGMSAALSNGDTNNSTATSALDVRNNIFALTANVSTTATYYGFYTTATSLTGATFDYNDYFLNGTGSATFRTAYFNSTPYTTLANWQTASGQEAHSLQVDPQFTQTSTVPFNLTPTAPFLNAAGVTLAGITLDYAGTTRTSPPDIGALEFTPPPTNDAGVVAITQPIAPFNPSVQNIAVQVKNFGGAVLNTVTVSYTVNGVAQTPVTFGTGTPLNLAPGATSTDLVLGTFDFSVGGPSFVIVATTSQPNGSTDINTANDSFTRTVVPALIGTYTVGAGQQFTTLTSAVNTLNSAGVAGAVTFSLTDASYTTAETFPITVNTVLGGSTTNTVTIKPASGVSPIISGSSTTAILKLNGADYVTIDGSNTTGGTTRDLSVTNTSTGTSAVVIWLASVSATDGATFDVVKNLNLTGGSNTTSTSTLSVSRGIALAGTTVTAAGQNNDNNTLQNNAISKVTVGIDAEATSTEAYDNLLIVDNVVGLATSTAASNVTGTGIFTVQTPGVQITHNTVQNVTAALSGSLRGIALSTGTAGALVNRNTVRGTYNSTTGGYGARGISLDPGTGTANITLRNNAVSGTLSDGDNPSNSLNYIIAGMGFISGTGYNVYNNSVQMSGDRPDNTYTNKVSAPVFVATAVTGIDLRNNVLSNVQTTSDPDATGTGTNYAVYAQAPTGNPFTTIDYNLYDLRSGAASRIAAVAPQFVGRLTGADYATLATWQTATGQDRSSMMTSGLNTAGFTSATDLTPNPASPSSYSVNGTGVQIASVTQDLNGATRSTTAAAGAPDLGAYEVTPTVAPNPLEATGTYALGGTQTFSFNGRTIASLTYGNTGTLPATLTARYYSGTNPPAPYVAGARFYNAYFTFSDSGDGTGFSYVPTLSYDPALLGTIPSENAQKVAQQTATGYGTYFSTVVNTGARTLNAAANLTAFGLLAITDQAAPLPVELTRFEATRAGSDAALAWNTASEKNSRGFEVQVSTDGRSYRVLSFVASPTAASTSPREYAYLDREASKAGLRYYRLRQLDLDGTATFSPVRILRFEGKDARSFTAAPNPFRERLTLTVELPAGLVAAPALLSLTDAAGRSLLTQRTPALPAGTSQLELPDLAPLASGVYFVHLAVPGQPVQHLKVVKE
ncbi:beta strand repeat-containing protein [Hymenobacter siberiensis]|uniref:beta strand repeat-containing protein n=1 Tax=Hymenobacter siberiensis TaxID=2848396 RepID=UPI001C1E53A6|nr:BNR-repeat neuraminidase N-terminal domain-containing protein [Hymenobacter siberiensis]MBU6120607.1 hypothetical protein [Hymenobacter siberiensis]